MSKLLLIKPTVDTSQAMSYLEEVAILTSAGMSIPLAAMSLMQYSGGRSMSSLIDAVRDLADGKLTPDKAGELVDNIERAWNTNIKHTKELLKADGAAGSQEGTSDSGEPTERVPTYEESAT